MEKVHPSRNSSLLAPSSLCLVPEILLVLSPSRIWTYDQSVNSRPLYHWATEEQRKEADSRSLDQPMTEQKCVRHSFSHTPGEKVTIASPSPAGEPPGQGGGGQPNHPLSKFILIMVSEQVNITQLIGILESVLSIQAFHQC